MEFRKNFSHATEIQLICELKLKQATRVELLCCAIVSLEVFNSKRGASLHARACRKQLQNVCCGLRARHFCSAGKVSFSLLRQQAASILHACVSLALTNQFIKA